MASRADANNRAYIASITAQLRKVPRVAAIEIARRVFIGVVKHTVVDSGQAAFNWHMQPYVGQPVFLQQQILWGYGSVAPVSPVGYKWSSGANAELVLGAMLEAGAMMAAQLEDMHFTGISVYNPITPGFAGFTPDDDSSYFENALGDVEKALAQIVSDAAYEGYQATAQQFTFLRYS